MKNKFKTLWREISVFGYSSPNTGGNIPCYHFLPMLSVDDQETISNRRPLACARRVFFRWVQCFVSLAAISIYHDCLNTINHRSTLWLLGIIGKRTATYDCKHFNKEIMKRRRGIKGRERGSERKVKK